MWGGGGGGGGVWGGGMGGGGGVCLNFYKPLEVIGIYAEVKKATHNRYTSIF